MKLGYVMYNVYNKGIYKLVFDKLLSKLFVFKLIWIRLYFLFGYYFFFVLYLKCKEFLYNFY